MSDPCDLNAFLDHAWQRLSRGVADRRSGARHVSFSTVSPDGFPQVRTVVLRAAQKSQNLVEVHTDAASAKVSALGAHPYAQLMIWDEKPRLQIRLDARVDVLGGADVSDTWDRVPPVSRESYGKMPAPGAPIDEAYAYKLLSDPAAFRVLRCHVHQIDLVELGETHRRATYRLEDDWAGQWLVP